mgnify:CR=1 FL=1
MAGAVEPATQIGVGNPTRRTFDDYIDAGVPKGVVNLVLGNGTDVGDPIIAHPDVSLISFTGSTETGVRVATEAGFDAEARVVCETPELAHWKEAASAD